MMVALCLVAYVVLGIAFAAAVIKFDLIDDDLEPVLLGMLMLIWPGLLAFMIFGGLMFGLGKLAELIAGRGAKDD